MAERYEILFKVEDNLYCEGSPVLIEAGQLLKDNAEQGVAAQLKFKNLTSRTIKALSVQIASQDVMGNDLGRSSYQYLDLEVGRGKSFGSRVAIPLPNAAARGIECACRAVVFDDGGAWEWDGESAWEPLPKIVPLSDHLIPDLYEQYKIDTSMVSEHKPFEHKDLWMCSCGAFNRTSDVICEHCGHSKSVIFDSLKIDGLKERKKGREDAEAERRAQIERERQEKLEAKKAKADEAKAARKKSVENAKALMRRKSKIIIAAMASLALVAIVAVLAVKVVIPEMQYQSALGMLESGEYEKAAEAFDDLGTYKDSVFREKEARNKADYAMAEQAFSNGDYATAESLFLRLGAYSDAEERAAEAKRARVERSDADHLEKAKKYVEAGNYEEALRELNQMESESPEAKELHDFARCGRGVELYYAGSVESGIELIDVAETKTEEALAIKAEFDAFMSKYGKWLGAWVESSKQHYDRDRGEWVFDDDWSYYISYKYDSGLELFIKTDTKYSDGTREAFEMAGGDGRFGDVGNNRVRELVIIDENTLELETIYTTNDYLRYVDTNKMVKDYGDGEITYHRIAEE